ncbi:L-glyceraldehyde 3-phosphate reductase [Massilia forsythiae]|uniref:L-glyceraldehyde 3-phosphate reductase n=1 Tax=Massilia forsythiae TaxID=2728020 RepID=A0A7Z2VYN6_9BURK|nr:aldo/keto reductase [Massilia forsythiae]QJE01847.1 L-glyceraldehyde 3-phosphate reductase [Massilia forsythiae]
MSWQAAPSRYDTMPYPHCGRSGLRLPAVSLGLWHNFGGEGADLARQREIVRTAFDHGVTCFDLANNYGPPPGSAERNFGRLFDLYLRPYRDELVVCTKAGYTMWPGPYGDWGSRKYLVASLDQSLKRMGLDYVDVFYHHRPDPSTPLEETMAALDWIVRSGRALYAGISNYNGEQTRRAAAELRRLGTPCVVNQSRYSMLVRGVEDDLLPVLEQEGIGGVAFSPLAQGLLTDRYLGGALPADSRAAGGVGFLRPEHVTDERLDVARRLDAIAREGGQSLAQLALRWVKRQPAVTSVLIGASKPRQVLDAVRAVQMPALGGDELAAIEEILLAG